MTMSTSRVTPRRLRSSCCRSSLRTRSSFQALKKKRGSQWVSMSSSSTGLQAAEPTKAMTSPKRAALRSIRSARAVDLPWRRPPQRARLNGIFLVSLLESHGGRMLSA